MWLEARRSGIGGSDAAAILGLDPWRSPVDIWRSKVAPAPPSDEEIFQFKLGHLLEPVIAGLYVEQTGNEVVSPNPEIVSHSLYPELAGSPDRLAIKAGRVVELKSEHQFADKFGDAGSDQVPEHYVIQCMHYMALANLDRCDVAVLHGGFKFATYQLQRDLEAEKSLVEQLREWWHAYVVKKIEPPLDASEAWGDYLAFKYPFNKGPIVKVDENSNPDLMRHVYNALNYADQIKAFKTRLEEARNQIKAFIAENDGVRGPWGQITWRLCKDSTEVQINFDHLLNELQHRYRIPEDEMVELREGHMQSVITKKGGRRFVAKRAKDVDSPIPTNNDEETLFNVS